MSNRDKLIAELGEDGYRQKMREWGSKGGKAKVPKGLAKQSASRKKTIATMGGRMKKPLQK